MSSITGAIVATAGATAGASVPNIFPIFPNIPPVSSGVGAAELGSGLVDKSVTFLSTSSILFSILAIAS